MFLYHCHLAFLRGACKLTMELTCWKGGEFHSSYLSFWKRPYLSTAQPSASVEPFCQWAPTYVIMIQNVSVRNQLIWGKERNRRNYLEQRKTLRFTEGNQLAQGHTARDGAGCRTVTQTPLSEARALSTAMCYLPREYLPGCEHWYLPIFIFPLALQITAIKTYASPSHSQLYVNEAPINYTNVATDKGVIHGLGKVLEIQKNRCDNNNTTIVQVSYIHSQWCN